MKHAKKKFYKKVGQLMKKHKDWPWGEIMLDHNYKRLVRRNIKKMKEDLAPPIFYVDTSTYQDFSDAYDRARPRIEIDITGFTSPQS